MTTLAYTYSLTVSITLLLFFGIYFMVGKLPDKDIYTTYRRSRTVMGVALLCLAANYSVHLFGMPRFRSPQTAIFINLSTYFLEVWLFSCALTTLLRRDYLTRRRFMSHIAGWVAYTSLSVLAMMLLPSPPARLVVLCVMAAIFLVYSFLLARRLFLTYRSAVRAFDDYHSDHIAAYIHWMSIFTYWAIIFGVAQGALTFLPARFVFLWIISAIPFYIYLYVSYTRYLLFYEQVEEALCAECDTVADIAPPPPLPPIQEEFNADLYPASYKVLFEKVQAWIERKGFTKQGLTITDLSRELATNRTYMADFIHSHYHSSFREWINKLRMDYAKQLLTTQAESTTANIARQAGYISLSNFIKLFYHTHNMTPGRWRRHNSSTNP